MGQVQPWGTLSGLTLGYEISPRWDMTLSWGALTSDVDDELVTGAKEPRTLRQVRLRSVLLGTRWFPLRHTRWRPFAAVGSFEGVEQGNLFDGTDRSKSQSSFGSQFGGGLDVDLTDQIFVGTHPIQLDARFTESVGGRHEYRGVEFPVAASWRFGGQR